MRTSAGQPPELPGAMPRIRSITETVSIADTAARRAALCAEYFAGGEVPALRGLPDRTLAGWIAVKRAVVKVLGPDSSPSEIVVEPVGTGGVSVRIRGKEGPRVRVSVSHTRDIAYGIACVEDPA